MITEHNDRMPSSGDIYTTQKSLNALYQAYTIHPVPSLEVGRSSSQKRNEKIFKIIERRQNLLL